MTAGTGVRHSEYTQGDKPRRFIQTWIVPSQRSLTPNYGSYNGQSTEGESELPTTHSRKNQLHHVVCNVLDKATRTPIEINQDLWPNWIWEKK
jgi:redox-sensitive bicupin YhaK (pirin superfamily)